MSASLRDDDEEFKVGGVKGGLRSKPRFSYTEVRVLLEAVKRNRYIILRKFNQGVSAEAKKKTWAEITNQINSLGENHREVRQIMKKWADLKCDGKRRIAALRGPNGSNLRKKNLGPVEKMVHKILMMSPRGDGDSDPDDEDEALTALINNKGLLSNPPPYSYLSVTESSHSLPGGASLDLSPLSSPEKELGDPFHSSSDFDLELDFADDGDRTMDWDENNDPSFSAQLPPSSLDPLPDNALMRVKPVYTYSRSNSQNHNHTSARPPPGPSSSTATTSSVFPAVSDSAGASSSAAPPPPQSPASSNVTASCLPAPSSSSSTSVAATDSAAEPVASTSSIPPPPPPTSGAVSSSPSSSGATTTSAPSTSVPAASSRKPPASSLAPPNPHSSTSGSKPSDPLPPGASFRRSQDHVAQMASQSVQQQRASRLLLTSVSQSLEILAQSVQLLVESQQEFVQESLLLQRETVDILRDFSNTALTMLRDKGNGGHTATHHPPNHPPSH